LLELRLGRQISRESLADDQAAGESQNRKNGKTKAFFKIGHYVTSLLVGQLILFISKGAVLRELLFSMRQAQAKLSRSKPVLGA
jgi:hypothetical protein